jgi:hypothetical protein
LATDAVPAPVQGLTICFSRFSQNYCDKFHPLIYYFILRNEAEVSAAASDNSMSSSAMIAFSTR